MRRASPSYRWFRVVAWLLALSYGLGAPWTVFLEFRSDTLSDRFDLSPALIYGTCALQMLCAIGVLVPRFAFWAAVGLTLITAGAIVCHFRIGSPETSVAAFVYTAVQVWFGVMSRARVQA